MPLIDTPWFTVFDQETRARAAGAFVADREEWLGANDQRTEADWDEMTAYLASQSRIATAVAPTLEALSWSVIPHEFAQRAGEWPTVWDCWRAGARMRLPHVAMLLDFAPDGDPFMFGEGALSYALYGAVVTPAPGAGILVHAIGGPSVWEGMYHFAPYAMVPDDVAAQLAAGTLPWGYDEAVVRTPGSSAVLLPRRTKPKLLARWSGGVAASVAVGVLELGDFDESALESVSAY